MSEWQPIEKDGEQIAPHDVEVLLYSPPWSHGPEKIEVGFASHGWRHGSVSNMSLHGSATHWQHLPMPPTDKEEGHPHGPIRKLARSGGRGN